MDLTVRLFAVLRERAGQDELLLRDLPPELDLAELKRELEARHPELGSLEHVAAVLGTSYVPDDTAVDGTLEVSLLPPVSGGDAAASDAGERAVDLERGVFELSAEPLDPAAVQRRVTHASCGAVVLFTGVTRETNRGRDVERLDYEAFAEMAGAEMARIFDETREHFGPPPAATEGAAEGAAGSAAQEPGALALRMLCQHRTGTVAVGEPSVVIGVASPHRDAAFRAARHLIDELKARVPLWKKEVYDAGQHWIGDRS